MQCHMCGTLATNHHSMCYHAMSYRWCIFKEAVHSVTPWLTMHYMIMYCSIMFHLGHYMSASHTHGGVHPSMVDSYEAKTRTITLCAGALVVWLGVVLRASLLVHGLTRRLFCTLASYCYIYMWPHTPAYMYTQHTFNSHAQLRHELLLKHHLVDLRPN